jgi:hypothetical protein
MRANRRPFVAWSFVFITLTAILGYLRGWDFIVGLCVFMAVGVTIAVMSIVQGWPGIWRSLGLIGIVLFLWFLWTSSWDNLIFLAFVVGLIMIGVALNRHQWRRAGIIAGIMVIGFLIWQVGDAAYCNLNKVQVGNLKPTWWPGNNCSGQPVVSQAPAPVAQPVQSAGQPPQPAATQQSQTTPTAQNTIDENEAIRQAHWKNDPMVQHNIAQRPFVVDDRKK